MTQKKEDNYIRSYFLTAWVVVILFFKCEGAVYKDVSKLYDDKLGSNSNYKTMIRPIVDQGKVLQVNVTFDIVAIVEINAITQKFVVNGFLGMAWTDQMVAWEPTDYNHTYAIHPEPKQIWRPRLILTNTIEARDLFEDDHCPVTAVFNGLMVWFPGSLFPTSCKLNLYKYPFDEQECYIEMYSMGQSVAELEFKASLDIVGTDFYVKSGEWNIESTKLEAFVPEEVEKMSSFKMTFKLRRLPGFFIVNIVTPIVLMSFLNILVFLIPVDSGEKISYGITVLLALTVFMSIVSEQLPRSSDTLPIVTIYLLVLTIISVCTVIMSILIVYCHHRDEKEVKHQKAASSFKSMFRKVNIMNRTADNFKKVKVKPATIDHQFSNSSTTKVDSNTLTEKNRDSHDQIFNILENHKEDYNNTMRCENQPDGNFVNRWRQIGKHLDCLSFIVFTIIWISVTIGFLVEIAR